MNNWINTHTTVSIIIAILFTIGIFIVITVNNIPDTGSGFAKVPKANAADLQDGRMLAGQYCRTCHMLPDPSLLTKEMWYTGILPRMGPFLGYTSFWGESYARANDVSPSYFPVKPIIDSVKWSHIIAYFVNTAPNRMPEQKKSVSVIKHLPFFDVQLPESVFFGTVSMTSYVKIDTTVTPHHILISDGINNRFVVLDDHLKTLFAARVSGSIVDINSKPGNILVCSIGANLEANNLRNGEIRGIALDKQGKIKADNKPLFDKLARPVKITRADLNGDGKEDFIISQFGNMVGDLSWMENTGDGKYKSHVLRKKPGALGTIVQDYNHDGLPDLWAQFAQGEEGVFLYTNKGHGEFKEQQVLRFPPSYGSTSFDLVDFNHDGFMDIIYTCGDNGDYTRVLKPYHGVYIFLNDGKNNFAQRYFYPINGCYKAIARDFDGDGDLDIATVSFYPSDHQPEEAFIYLENKGNFNFQPYSLPANIPFQKGITMDAADLDGDGKTDLILGNGYFTSASASKHKEPLFIILKNTTSIHKTTERIVSNTKNDK
ncbi:MAG: repeat-containing protein [Mucilaginibacter sp.]|nr:repeat-containing protein [Mucilaginibacter sp.]